MQVTGYPLGWNQGSSEKSIRFVITNESKAVGPKVSAKLEKYTSDAEHISLVAHTSLPSTCSFLEYTLVVRHAKYGSLYEVIRILSCKKRVHSISKKDIKDIISNKSKRDDIKGDGALHNLPATITSERDIIDNIKNEAMRDWVLGICRDFFRSERYMSLMKYFHSVYLSRFTNAEIDYMTAALNVVPHVFMFRNLMERVFDNIPLREGSNIMMFPRSKKHRFKSNMQGYYKDTKMIALKETQPVYFSDGMPFVRVGDLYDADGVIEAAALDIYLQCEDMMQSFGHTIFTIPDLRTLHYKRTEDDPVTLKYNAVEFLIQNDIMMRSYHSDKLLVYPEVEAIEVDLITYLNDNVSQPIEVINSNDYGSGYVKKLSKYIINKKGMNAIVVSSGMDCASQLSIASGIPVYTYTTLKEARQKNNQLPTHNVLLVLDRCHKMPLEMVLDILTSFKEVELTVLGDDSEYSVHPKSGIGGALFHVLCSLDRGTNFIKWAAGQEDYITSIWSKALVNLDKIVVDDVTNLPAKVNDIEKFHKKHNKEKMKEQQQQNDGKKLAYKAQQQLQQQNKRSAHCQIFCSSTEDKNILMRVLKGSDYNAYKYNIGDHVHVIQLGMIGELKRAWKQSETGVWTEIPNKISMYINTRPHKLLISNQYKDVEVYTQEVTVTHSEVETVNRYPGLMVDHGVLYLSSSTKEVDLKSAAKYCRLSFRIAMKNGFNINSVYSKGEYKVPWSDLSKKFKQYFSPMK
jgi:hypothetical protein